MSNELIKKQTGLEKNLNTEIENLFSGLQVKTREIYLTAINQFLDFTNKGINDYQDFTEKDIIDFIAYLKKKYSLSSVNAKLSGLKKVFKIISTLTGNKNIFNTLKELNIKTSFQTEKTITKDKTLSEQEIKTLIEYYTGKNKSYAMAIKTLYKQGLRISELLSLRIKDFKKTKDDNGNTFYKISITGKGSKNRTLFFDTELYNELKNISDKDSIFNFTRNAFSMDLMRISEKVLNHTITAHNLRHSFATNLNSKRPEKLKAISKYSGHSNSSITLNMYIHDSLDLNDLTALTI